MFCILNFKDHSFVQVNNHEQVEKIIKTLIKSGSADIDDIEIDVVNDDERFYSIEEFRQDWWRY